MIYLRYLRKNTAKIREYKQKLAIETVCAPTSGVCLNLLRRRAHQVTVATFPPSQRGPGFG